MTSEVKILAIDDELSVLESLKLVLEFKDYKVTTAQNLAEAVAAAQKEKFDIAFIDLRFEGRDIGLDILKRIKEISPGTECVIVTAYASDKTKSDALNLGAMDYLSKPFLMEQIYQMVGRALANKKF